MKPQIDSMFRRTTSAEHPVTSPSGSRPPATLPTPPTSGTSTPAFGSSLLSSVAAQATAQPPTPARTPPTAETSPLTLVTSSSNFSSILQQHPAVVVNFTNTPSCPPCRAIKPVYESIAAEHASTYGVKGARFVEVELSIGEGNQIASSYGVRATPTFIFFKDGKKVDEMKGAAKRELEGKVEEFLESIWPRHPHRKIYMPLIEKIPINPITSTATPNYPALLKKLESLGAVKSDVDVLRDQVVPLLEGKQTSSDRSVQAALASWCPSTVNMANSLDPSSLFPLVDLWRVGVSNPVIAAALALDLSADSTENRAGDSAVGQLLAIVAATLKKQGADTPKPLLLTALRLITNILAALPLTNLLLSRSSSPRLYSVQQDLLSITVESLLHTEVTVRSAAAGVAVNMASWRHRIAKETRTVPEDEPEADWEVELVSALVEGVGRESDEDVGKFSDLFLLTIGADGATAHRLLVALALTIYLSPGYLESLRSLLEVLDAKGIIESRMKGWKKAEVRKLATEMTSKLMR